MKLIFDLHIELIGPDKFDKIPLTNACGQFEGSLAGKFLTFIHDVCNLFSLEYNMDVLCSDFVTPHTYSVIFSRKFICQVNFLIDIVSIEDSWSLNHVRYKDLIYDSFVDAHDLRYIISDEVGNVFSTVA